MREKENSANSVSKLALQGHWRAKTDRDNGDWTRASFSKGKRSKEGGKGKVADEEKEDYHGVGMMDGDGYRQC